MKHSEMIQTAKKAVAGAQLMTEIIDHINARRPDIVEKAVSEALNVESGADQATCDAAMNKRAEDVTAFDAYEDRVAALETVVRDLVKYHAYESGKDNEANMSSAVGRAKKVLKSC